MYFCLTQKLPKQSEMSSASSENDHARFSCGSELELASFFEFDSALEELTQCSVRRREKLGRLPAQTEKSSAVTSSRACSDEVPARGIRFDDEELQAQFIADLTGTGIANKPFDIVARGDALSLDPQPPWLLCVARDGLFTGAGDPSTLEEIIEIFLEWAL